MILLAFIIGIIAGGCFGFVISGLMFMSGRGDEQ